MAINTTTLSSAYAIGDNKLVVASATGAAVGKFALVDGELFLIQQSYDGTSTTVPVIAGQQGTAAVAHAKTANVIFFTGATDETTQVPQVVPQWPNVRGRDVISYSAAGAIGLPAPGSDRVAIINGTSTLAMTLANPTTDMDGSILYIVGNGKSASTVTYTAGLGNGGSALDVLTFASGGQQCLALIAANAIWVPLPSVLGGTLTNITITAS